MPRSIMFITTAVLPMVWAKSSFAQSDGDSYFWGPEWGLGHMGFGGLMMIAFWGAIILLAVLLVRSLGGMGNAPISPRRPTPLEVLQARFANGEIDKGEFEERRRTLTK